jgi:nucleoside-diphosphate-sugar epimerase
MHILIVGAAGMIGRKLAQKLTDTGTLNGHNITEMTLFDVVEPTAPNGFDGPVHLLTGDLANPQTAFELVTEKPDVVFHLAAVVSGEAEQDFEKGYRINMGGTQNLLEAIRLTGFCPRFLFASSLAVFGTPLPDIISDNFNATPLSSYGTQKAIGELLVNDYSRKGFIDGISLRLPTIVIRPGPPNKAASSFFSNILREPLKGEPAILPVPKCTRHWFTSPRMAVGFLIHAASLNTAELGWRTLNLPGVSASIAEMIQALKRVAGSKTVDLISEQPDPLIEAIISSWPKAFHPARAQALGFEAETGFTQIIQAYLEDEDGSPASIPDRLS